MHISILVSHGHIMTTYLTYLLSYVLLYISCHFFSIFLFLFWLFNLAKFNIIIPFFRTVLYAIHYLMPRCVVFPSQHLKHTDKTCGGFFLLATIFNGLFPRCQMLLDIWLHENNANCNTEAALNIVILKIILYAFRKQTLEVQIKLMALD